jgi:hypothetical protein
MLKKKGDKRRAACCSHRAVNELFLLNACEKLFLPFIAIASGGFSDSLFKPPEPDDAINLRKKVFSSQNVIRKLFFYSSLVSRCSQFDLLICRMTMARLTMFSSICHSSPVTSSKAS